MQRSVTGLLVCLMFSISVRAQTFTDVSEQLTPAATNSGWGSSAADINNDGWVDIYQVGAIYLNKAGEGFSESLYLSRIDEGQSVFGGLWGDFDNNGYLDLFTENFGPPSNLYRNDRNRTFSYANDETGLFVPDLTQGAAWADFNLDGTLDLFANEDNGHNQMLRNEAFLYFTDISDEANAPTDGNSYGMSWADYDNDGDPDVFIATCNPSILNSIKHLLRNNGDETFTDVNYEAGVADSMASWGIVWLDYDNDGDWDIHIANTEHLPRPGHNKLYRNDGDGTFTDVTFDAGVEGGSSDNSYGNASADFDNDGYVDIYVANAGSAHQLYHNSGDGTFLDIAYDAGLTNWLSPGVAVADFNNDGWMDIFTGGWGTLQLMLNDGGDNNWTKVALRGIQNNYYGVGTRVEVYSDDQFQVREIRAGDSFCSQNDQLTVHFGLGQANQIDSLILNWPGGGVDKYYNLAVNRMITLVEGIGENERPDSPRLISPEDAATLSDIGTTIDFSWSQPRNEAESDLTYNLYLVGLAGDTTIEALTDTVYTLDKSILEALQIYYWSADVSDGYSITASTNAHFVYPGASTISGTVIDESGQPMSGIDVLLESENLLENTNAELTATTDETGFYEFANLPVLEGIINYSSLYVSQIWPYPSFEQTDLPIVIGEVVEIDIDFAPAEMLVINGYDTQPLNAELSEAFGLASVTVFDWNRTELGAEIPLVEFNGYGPNGVIWMSGEMESDLFVAEDLENIANFIDDGGNMLLTGTQIGSFLHEFDPDFLSSYFHVQFADYAPATPVIIANPDNPVFGDIGDLTAIQPERNAFEQIDAIPSVAFNYFDDQIAAATLEATTSGSHLAIFGFGLEEVVHQHRQADVLAALGEWWGVSTDIGDTDNPAIPKTVQLHQNYPNPFNPSTTISYELPFTGNITLSIYDASGRLVRELANGVSGPGLHKVVWDGANGNGNEVSSGVYFYRLNYDQNDSPLGKGAGRDVSQFSETKKMILLR